jgi:uncharacterized protein
MRRLAVFCITAVIVALAASSASAHVTVSPSTAPKGGFATLGFSVPNESDTASTVKIELTIPQNRKITSIRVQPKAGWQTTVQKTGALVTGVTWEGGRIDPDEFDVFTISAGPLPKAKQIMFKVVQTYSDGSEVRWIEPQPKGTPEPEHPAPVLTLKGTASHHE